MSTNGNLVPYIQGQEQPLEKSLELLVDNSKSSGHLDAQSASVPVTTSGDAIHTAQPHQARSWLSKLWPSEEHLEQLFAWGHLGNYVIDRRTGQRQLESMPLYVRVGMHLLFCNGRKFDSYVSVEDLLTQQSVKQGQMYDATGDQVLPHIQSFIQTYNLPLNELLEPDLTKYPTFNAFFSRKLTEAARPIAGVGNASVFVSPADCRMNVFNDIDSAKKFWVKGQQFSVPELLGHEEGCDTLQRDGKSMLVIARLAPQDYHRFHAPCDATVISVKDIPGQLYTVNPQAINEDLNVFTKNKRSVMLVSANLGPGREQVPLAFVAIGAMLVGSIGWSKKPGESVKKGEELGWFQYGGSTVILVSPSQDQTGLQFDADLVSNSEKSTETVVTMGTQIGTLQ